MVKRKNNGNQTPGLPPRGEIQDDFTPRRAGRSHQFMELWAPEIEVLASDYFDKVVPYEGVHQNVATQLRTNFDRFELADGRIVTVEAAMRNIDPDTKEGRLEVRVSAYNEDEDAKAQPEEIAS